MDISVAGTLLVTGPGYTHLYISTLADSTNITLVEVVVADSEPSAE